MRKTANAPVLTSPGPQDATATSDPNPGFRMSLDLALARIEFHHKVPIPSHVVAVLHQKGLVIITATGTLERTEDGNHRFYWGNSQNFKKGRESPAKTFRRLCDNLHKKIQEMCEKDPQSLIDQYNYHKSLGLTGEQALQSTTIATLHQFYNTIGFHPHAQNIQRMRQYLKPAAPGTEKDTDITQNIIREFNAAEPQKETGEPLETREEFPIDE
ncbi:hypothetical protein OH491_23545 [Termitidicoccus mucosus]|uniref:Uncharacterized protein n=1 Tax=Termitidicoccus mucosus TaxID=1184151 RepID=A0A178INS5_9BACT|nr:hypothetical protein AW736_02930 [Opitutaceae bacterium TSB47]